MDWTYPTTDPDRRAQGIAEMAERLVSLIGDRQLEGTCFTYDAREMLRATHEIEGSLGDSLVGDAGGMHPQTSSALT
ncbi:MAG: hypothetical protein ACR2K4_00150 [Candidatus Limnocylindria bacterium]